MRRKAEGAALETAVIFKSKLGWAGAMVSDKGLARVVLPKENKKTVERELTDAAHGIRSFDKEAAGLSKKAAVLLTKYFVGERVLFDLPLDMRYYTPFQRAVWRAASEIPSGETRSYAWIARKIKRPNAARAVGQALGTNPVPVVIPCHRVIASSGTLGGFSGGLGMKKKLLTLENKMINHRVHREKRT